MTDSVKQTDWVGFFLQFFFGAVFGVFMGLYFWANSEAVQTGALSHGIFITAVTSLFCGIAAGCAKDDFWGEAPLRHSRWLFALIIVAFTLIALIVAV